MDTSLPELETATPTADSPPDDSANIEATEPVPMAATESPSVAAEPESTPSVVAESPPPISIDLSRVAQDLQIRKVQVEALVQLFDEGNTVPFIARYRLDRIGGLHEEMIRRVRHRVGQLRHLAERKQTILKSIANHGPLSDELRAAIMAAENPKRLEDLYLPYKPKKRSLASDARDKGLEPLAKAIWHRDPAVERLDELLPTIVDPEKGLNTTEDVIQGVGHILAEQIAETAEIRGILRMLLWDTGRLAVAKSETLPEGKGLEFKDYFQFTEPIRHVPPHRVLAINRGEKENALKVRFKFDADLVRRVTTERLPLGDHPHLARLTPMVDDALSRILLPTLERELRRELTERAQDHAIGVFARNLRSLLLQPPLRGKRVLAIDPGLRTGCKLAVLDEAGNLLDHALIHPHQPQKRLAEARHTLEELIRKHQVSVIAIGNGTASRDTEELVAGLLSEFDARRRGEFSARQADSPAPVAPAPSVVSEVPAASDTHVTPLVVTPPSLSFAFTSSDFSTAGPPPAPAEPNPEPQPTTGEGFSIVSEFPNLASASTAIGAAPTGQPTSAPPLPSLDGLAEPALDLAYVVVNEAGARDYATSPLGREEFPTFDAALRIAISIGRRLQDPLSELVKVDPQNVGVGLYQHDVHPRHLKEMLAEIIESCVNHVGVDVNSAGVSLLRYVAGLNPHVARELVEFRNKNGPFAGRERLKEVPNLSESRWTQAAGFLKVTNGTEPLDATWIHPESYPAARQLLADAGLDTSVLVDPSSDAARREKLNTISTEEASSRLHLSPGTVHDLLDELARPGRDPRDDLPPPVFKKGMLRLEDLNAGMELKGTVLNVVPFGAFIDVGLRDSGLVHISQMANRYIKSPHEVVAVGDVVNVWVLNVDADRRRASLTMIPPGTERRPPEHRPQRGERPPGGPRPANAERGVQSRGEPQRRGPRPPRPGGRHATGDHSAAAPAAGEPSLPRAPRQLPERRPPKPRPLPNLTQAKKEGKEYLNTLGELAAFFKAREAPEPPAEQPPTS